MLFKLGWQTSDNFFKPHLGKWSSLAFYLFWLLVVTLVSGVFISLWPTAVVKITPQTDKLSLATSLHISLDLTGGSPNSWLVAGRQLQAGEDWSALERSGYRVYSVGKQNIAAAEKDLRASLDKFVKQNMPVDYLIVPESLAIMWGDYQPDKSERGLNLPVSVVFSIYRHFPVVDWKNRLADLNLNEANSWLRKQTGVNSSTISIHPAFLAKIREKLPTNPNLIRFTLDIDGKTSILE